MDPLRFSAPVFDEPASPLYHSVEPDEFAAPVFGSALIASLIPSFATTQPINPVLAALPDGRLLAGTPTCDKLEPLGSDFQNRTEQDECQHRILFLSDEEGETWSRLNKEPRSRLDKRTDRTYGHIDVAADGNGTLFAVMDDAGYNDVFAYRSFDHGVTWNQTLSSVEPRSARDNGAQVSDARIAAAGTDRVIVGWRGCEQVNTSCWLAVKVSFRSGSSWSNPARFGEYVRAVGPFVVGPTGYDVHVAYLEGNGANGDAVLHILSSNNWGISWTDHDLGVLVARSQASQQRQAWYELPALGALGGGGLAVAWTEEDAPASAVSLAHVVRYMVRSPDGTWTQPVSAPSPGTSRFPSIVAGAGDRFALVYLAGTAPVDPLVQEWDVGTLLVDGNAGGSRTSETFLHEAIHVGGFCDGPTECLAGTPRLFLEYFEAVARPDGSLAYVYPVTTGPTVELRAAIQTGGSPLFVRAAS